ncbi:MAG TPA: DUF3857 domain-containing protein [Candidatus Acidoferrum sp.]|nr:DUF3857 domain-containing protein [Candidatus Acidoferrum sp.]
MKVSLMRGIAFSALFLLAVPLSAGSRTQEPKKKAEAKAEPELPAQIELLETKYRFETNGDSRKEVYARVKINNALGEEQFARLKFQYNRSFQSVEIPLVKIIHPRGGTAEILPSAIADNPDPAVVNFPAYQEVRQKSVRILGLAPGDLLEYRVVTMTTHPPLAPNFWLEHSFDRTGVVGHEAFELSVPASRKVRVWIRPDAPFASPKRTIDGGHPRILYKWELSENKEKLTGEQGSDPDFLVSTFGSWDSLSERLAGLLQPPRAESGSWIIPAEVSREAALLTRESKTDREKVQAIYNFVSQKIKTVDLPLGATGFRTRPAGEVLSSGYATAEDKFKLFAALVRPFSYPPAASLTGAPPSAEKLIPVPSLFGHLLVQVSTDRKDGSWLDPSLEVAPFGLVPASFRGKSAFALDDSRSVDLAAVYWEKVPEDLPFASAQSVEVSASLTADGALNAKVRYLMRGDNELLLRVAFHKTLGEKWKEVAQLLALSDGFRGKVTSVTTSDPYDTKDPFSVEYEVTQPKFVNWGKKPVRIPAILPLVGLPDPPQGDSTAKIELGTPLEVNMSAIVKLPPGATARVPPGTSVKRDYAEFSSEYAVQGDTLTASRHLHFLMRELPGERAFDYSAFVRAVQNDEAQDFTLERPEKQAPAATAKN